MKTQSAINKMEKLGTVIPDSGEMVCGYTVEVCGYVLGISLCTARYGMESDVSIYTHRIGAQRDSRSDCFPETWHSSFKQAVRSIENRSA